MHSEALQRLEDARLLASSSNPFSTSVHLLSLLGFELLLKLVYELELGTRAHGHNYDELFSKLPTAAHASILLSARRRVFSSALNTDHHAVLKEWSDNFINLRYPYEKYKGMTEAEYEKHAQEWAARGGPPADATFCYYPAELFGMVLALKEHADINLTLPQH